MGTLLIDRDAPSFEGAIAHIWIEEAAPADAPASLLAAIRMEGIVHRTGIADEIPFTIADPAGLPANARLRAWVDVAASGAPGPDDLFSADAVTLVDVPCVVQVESSSRGRVRDRR